ncbi:MAG: ADP-ribosylglycohydrolase family protein [Candidatus Riflebacteria bacterium]|nr:ADP-ribosylglycohydrolase family protein [Candidatus Riflebacteria bacterium]
MIDKFQASMLGFLIGDALASPIEDQVREVGSSGEPVSFYVKASPAHPLAHLSPGQYSDESQTMLLVAESLVAQKAFNIEDLAHRFVDWYQSQKLRSMWRFPGNTTFKAARKLASGVHWTLSGFPSAGVGAVVRTLPLALVFYHSPVFLKNSIEQSCKLSHTDSRVFGAAQAFAAMIRIGLEGGEPIPDVIIAAAIDRSQTYSSEIPRKLKLVKDALKMDVKMAVDTLGNSGYCLDSLSCALYMFLRSPRNFDEMIVSAANSGGDSDSIAAMAGAIFGVYNGLGAIPDKWFSPLEGLESTKKIACELFHVAEGKK